MVEQPAILVVDDDEHVAKLISLKLSREGFRVECARDGGEALARVDECRWALIILDVMMPVKDGWQVLKEIRARPEYAGLPILMLSGRAEDLANTGAGVAVMKKPFDPAALAREVKLLVAPRAGSEP